MQSDSFTVHTNRAEDHAAYRPDYAPRAVDALLGLTGVLPTWVVADIGSGTGNLARHLVRSVKRVYAVEPNDEICRQAERLLSGHASFKSVRGTAERTNLPSRCVDLIVVGQAIHWFDSEAAKLEFARIIKPDGWLAILWNRFGEDGCPDLLRCLPSAAFARCSFPASVSETWEQFLGGARSVAGAPCEGNPAYDAFREEQRRIFCAKATNGRITVNYVSELAVGRWSSPSSGEKMRHAKPVGLGAVANNEPGIAEGFSEDARSSTMDGPERAD